MEAAHGQAADNFSILSSRRRHAPFEVVILAKSLPRGQKRAQHQESFRCTHPRGRAPGDPCSSKFGRRRQRCRAGTPCGGRPRDWLLAGTPNSQQARRTRGYVAEARSENPASPHMRVGIMETCAWFVVRSSPVGPPSNRTAGSSSTILCEVGLEHSQLQSSLWLPRRSPRQRRPPVAQKRPSAAGAFPSEASSAPRIALGKSCHRTVPT